MKIRYIHAAPITALFLAYPAYALGRGCTGEHCGENIAIAFVAIFSISLIALIRPIKEKGLFKALRESTLALLWTFALLLSAFGLAFYRLLSTLFS